MPASNGETLPWKLLHQLAPGKLRISSDGVLPTSRFPDIESSHVPTSPKHSAPIGHSSTPGFSIAETAFIIFFWYLSSAVGNNLNKEILSETVFPFPVTITLSQFGFVVFFSMIRFAYFGIERQRIDRQMLIKLIVPLCISQVFAHLFTEIAVQRIPVSFVHTVKASSPLFAILLTFYYRFSEQYSVLLVLSIVLTMSGVALSSLNEANFNLLGFCAALASTLIFCWQNAFSKKIFVDKQLDHHNLLFYTSFSAFCFLFPFWLAIDLPKILVRESVWLLFSRDAVFNTLSMFFLYGVCYFGQNITAFTFMTRVTPLTYTLWNTFKRIFVIVSSIHHFGNQVPPLNVAGIAMATIGVALYNKAKYDLHSRR
eukprot:TRINITY_DN396_c0_g2_i2.p1 TRINITY_DN396_c0_g2~~TRINITY_DN396_c0_g2_i2.p1  ORF type:complete len:406 (-),score=48.43 TRINITY_DN396_c0_g2_i2:361-1470(-)